MICLHSFLDSLTMFNHKIVARFLLASSLRLRVSGFKKLNFCRGSLIFTLIDIAAIHVYNLPFVEFNYSMMKSI
jgi:hypothetical protein